MKRLAVTLSVVAMFVACGGSDGSEINGAATGAERGACFANGTCNAGLNCLSNVCVVPNSSGGTSGSAGTSGTSGNAGNPDGSVLPNDSGTSGVDSGGEPIKDAGSDAKKVNDAGEPCPGAVIFHPGTETRDANTSVPFSGRGRDANCVPITGAKLLWTDSIGGGTIGTGETFNHTFTVKGDHTITLTSTDGAGASTTATVTFKIQ